MKPSRALSLFALLLLVAVLWSTSDLAAQVEPAGQAKEVGPVIKVLDAGKGAKTTLRFRIEKGLKQTMIMTMLMEQQMEMEGNKTPTPAMPAQKMTLDIEVTDVDAAGDIHYDFTISKIELVDDPDSPSPLAGILKTMLKPMEGSTGKAVVTSRGITKSVDFQLAEGVAAPLRQMMESMSQQSFQQMSSPMPAEPVGLGAKWEVTQDISTNGVKLKQISTQEIIELEGDRFKTKITLTQKADDQEVKVPGMAAVSARILSLSSQGKGEATVDLTQLVPLASKIELTSNAKMEVGVGDQKQTMATTTKVDVEVTNGEPAQ